MAARDIIPLVAELVKTAEQYRDNLSVDRIKATEYYDGIMTDTPSDVGRSAVVSFDVRSTIQKVLPSLCRVFLSSDKLVEYQPAEEEDDEQAAQATDYMNNVIFPECNGEEALEDAIYDSLKLKNAVLKWWYEEKTTVKVSTHTGLDDNAFADLVGENDVEVLEHTERIEMMDAPPQPPMMGMDAMQHQGPLPQVSTTVHDVKIKRKFVERKPVLSCRPLEEFLIHPDALEEDTAPLIGDKMRIRRGDLVAMGYDKDKVDELPITSSTTVTEDNERQTRRELTEGQRREAVTELQEIDYYDLLVRIDKDGDGIPELRRMCFGGAITEACKLMDEEADDVNYAIVAVSRKPHQWEGNSVADDTMDIQRIKTVLFRQTLDNLYWQNNLQVYAQRDAIENPDALTNPQFGQTVWGKAGKSAQDAMQPLTVPFVAEKSFSMLSYLDREKEERTGITDASGELPPDALQNVTAKASALLEQKGIGQSELMARTLSRGFARAFKGLLRLIIKHQDKPRTVRLRGKWVTFDPRDWNAGMDCTVNTGLGAGTRERDMMVMQGVLAIQKEIIAGMGQDNPYVKPDNLGNALTRFIEATGLKSPDLYVHKPTEQEIVAHQQAKANQPNPELEKVQAQIQGQAAMKKMDLEYEKEFKTLDVEAAKQKEIAQSQAAVEERVKIAQIEAEAQDKDRALKKYQMDQDHQEAMLNALLTKADSPDVMALLQGVVAKLILNNDGDPIMGLTPPQPKAQPVPHMGNLANGGMNA